MERDSFLNDQRPEERLAAMRDEYDRLELELDRERADLDQRRANIVPGPSRGLVAIRNREAALRRKEARANWLHSQLHPVAIDGLGVVGMDGYITCRSCNAQTGKEAAFERAGLCVSCFTAWTPSRQATNQTEGNDHE
jgi:hypothetical protein